jgi:hypothetical protein
VRQNANVRRHGRRPVNEHTQMTSRAKVTRWLFVVVFALALALGLVVQAAGGPWYGVAALGLMAVGAAYLVMLAPDQLVLRVDRWIATVLHWSP